MLPPEDRGVAGPLQKPFSRLNRMEPAPARRGLRFWLVAAGVTIVAVAEAIHGFWQWKQDTAGTAKDSPPAAAIVEPAPPQPPGGVTGQLRSSVDNSPIRGARVWLETDPPFDEGQMTVELDDLWEYLRTHPDPDPTMVAETWTGADGHYSLQAPPGDYMLMASAPGYTGPQVKGLLAAIRRIRKENAIMEGRAERDELPDDPDGLYPHMFTLVPGKWWILDFELDPGAILEGKVVDGRGAAVAGATIEFDQDIPGNDGFRDLCRKDVLGIGTAVRTDAEGNFRIIGLLPDVSVLVRVVHQGFAEARQRVPASDAVAQAWIVMKDESVLDGSVVDAAGRPVAGATFMVDRADWRDAADGSADFAGREVLFAVAGRSDGAGRFRVLAPSGVTRRLAAWAPGHGFAMIDLNSESRDSGKLVLPDADKTLLGLVVDDSGKPLPGAVLRVLTLEQHDAHSRRHFVFVTSLQGGPSPATDAGDFLLFPPEGIDAPLSPMTKSGADGCFAFQGLCLGAHHAAVLSVKAPGFKEQRFRVEDVEWTRLELEREDR